MKIINVYRRFGTYQGAPYDNLMLQVETDKASSGFRDSDLKEELLTGTKIIDLKIKCADWVKLCPNVPIRQAIGKNISIYYDSSKRPAQITLD